MKNEKELYELLHDVHTELEQYDIQPLNSLDKKRMRYSAKRIIKQYPKQKKQMYGKAWIAVACSMLLVCGVMMTDMGSSAVYAAGESMAYHISSFLGIDRNLSEYASVIGTEQTDNGYTIRLNEVILDQNTLIVSTNVYKTDSEGNVAEEIPMGIPIGDVYINGRDVANAAGGGARYDEADNSLGALIEYHLKENIDTTGELDIKLVFHNISVQEGRPSGEWKFHFVADGAALAQDTVCIPLDYIVTAENGARVYLSHYTDNVLSERIYYSIEGDLNKDIYMQGTDDLGNEVQFITHVYEGNYAGTKGSGYMKPYSVEMITDDTKTLTLTPYFAEDVIGEDGRYYRGELVQAGEPFTITLK